MPVRDGPCCSTCSYLGSYRVAGVIQSRVVNVGVVVEYVTLEYHIFPNLIRTLFTVSEG